MRFICLIAGLLAIAPLQRHIDGILGEFKEQEAVLLSWSGPTMKKLVPGFEGPVADLFWLRTVQYYGGQRVFAAGKKFDLVAPLVDVTVTLDPRMEVAYRLGEDVLVTGDLIHMRDGALTIAPAHWHDESQETRAWYTDEVATAVAQLMSPTPAMILTGHGHEIRQTAIDDFVRSHE